MTSNQMRAIGLAELLRSGEADAVTLLDPEWHLLLLAAGKSGHRVTPDVIANAVLTNATRRVGYFEPRERIRRNRVELCS